MSKPTKKFMDWYNVYGIMNDHLPFPYGQYAERIAFRAYKKGRKDEKEKIKRQYEKTRLKPAEFFTMIFGTSKKGKENGNQEKDDN